MGALPKHKLGKGRKGRRRSHDALKARNLVPCPNCRELRLPHQVCPACGHYKGSHVVEIKSE
ncbi:MAG: 50S ribosomal protein L32 [Anaerolineae bacterium]|nr:50S ribosomal protein L32 [Anaerolineae bacterium]